MATPLPAPDVTPRQAEIMRLHATGLSYRKVGKKLGLSVNTVKAHIRNSNIRVGKRELTAQQQLIVELIAAEGLTVKGAAQRLDRSTSTVITHLCAAYRILGVHSREELVEGWAKYRGRKI